MKKRKGFANFIVVLCIGIMTVLTACVVYEYHRLNTTINSSLYLAISGFFGGELLILSLRQIFGSDVFKKSTKDKDDADTV